jgi:hypothetical protein
MELEIAFTFALFCALTAALVAACERLGRKAP